ncbi:OB-fold protein [Flavisolibacter nicotianae]|uniref:OB-fold protein n=1 Tax=Flavisolibacter nicotianae TaxID=2364882 RepID=UPI000EB4595D|nr:hypothetical protein [Flavisolibacter nicotianae]
MKQLPFVLFVLFVCSFLFSSAQTITVKQLYDEYHSNSYNFEKQYTGKQLTIQGKIRSVKQGIKGLNAASAAFLTATGYENFVSCQFPIEDTITLSRLHADQVVTVTGTCKQVVRDAMVLANCTFATTAAKPAPKKDIPANIPLGLYHIYQANGSTFDFQYKFVLSSYTSYSIGGQTGNTVYDSRNKIIRFTTGKLKGFTGIYQPVNPDNEKDPPTIVMDVKGVPDVTKPYGKTYLLAFYQQ